MAWLGLDPDAAAMSFDNFFADGQTDAGAGKFFAFMQSLEHSKNSLEVLRIDPQAIVLYRERPLPAVVSVRGNMYVGDAGPLILDRIADKILKKLYELRLVRADDRERAVSHLGALLFDERTEICHRLLQRFLAGNIQQIDYSCPNARVDQQILNQPLHATGAVDSERNKLVGVRVELSLVPFRQKLCVAGHHSQWFLQIVRVNICKLPQF